jgi:NAD(P)-dependent dehydrogenase (short-subunit alcohol dehydrogenase family)
MEYGDAIGSPHQKPRFFTLSTLLPQWVSAASLSALPYCSDCERDTKLTWLADDVPCSCWCYLVQKRSAMFDLHGRTAIVTGAGRGIGRAVAAALIEHGAYVALLDRDAAAVAETVAQLGPRAQSVVVDVAAVHEVTAAIEDVITRWGRLDILVNNAAVLSTAPFLDLTPEEWHRVLNINLTAIYYTCRAAVPAMITAGYGRLITIASVAGKRGGGILGSAAYSAAKAGAIGLTKALARELAPFGITANTVCPGPVETPLLAAMTPELRDRAQRLIPLGRFAAPSEVAAAVVFLASTEAAFITGETLDVDGGLTMD